MLHSWASQQPKMRGGGSVAATYLPTTLATPYGAVYSLTKMVAAYSGDLAVACAVSAPDGVPTTLVPIPNSGDDSAAIAAFGAVYALYQQYDQSGNGYHTQVQATAINRPQVNSAYSVGKRSFTPPGGQAGGASDATWLDLPTSLATSRQNSMLVAILGGSSGGESNAALGVAALGATDVSAAAQLQSSGYGSAGGVSGRSNTEFTSPLPYDFEATFVGLSLSASATRVIRATQVSSTAAASAASMTGGRLGGAIFKTSGRFVKSYGHVVFQAVPTDADIATLRTSMNTMFGITTKTAQILADGDSYQCGVGSTNGRNKWYFVRQQLTVPTYVYNLGVGSQTITAISTAHDAAWFTAHYRADLTRNVYCLGGSVNDINAAGTDAALIAAYTALINAAKTAGFAVVVETITDGFKFVGAKETQRLTLNQWLRDNSVSMGFTVVDYASVVLVTDASSHPVSTAGGYPALANVAAPVLNAMLV